MMNKRTATVTWIKHLNFGSYLQAYALQQTIFRLGFDNAIIDDTPIIEEGLEKNQKLINKSIYCLKKFIIKIISLGDKNKRAFEKKQAYTKKQYFIFKTNLLKVDHNTIPLHDLDNRYDQFICGSDQIWAPTSNIFSPFYYLAFTKKKKIAYAPSIGITTYPEKFIPKVKPLLLQFDSLSIREEQGAEALYKTMGLKAEVVLDPTLLLSKDDWEGILQYDDIKKEQQPYIFCYFLSQNSWYWNFVKRFAESKNLPIKFFALNSQYLNFSENACFGGPIEFLSLLKNSEYAFTDSYHGSIFSILFQKYFFTFKRFSGKSALNQNSRIENLFSILDIPSYFIGEEDLNHINSLPPLNYDSILKKLHVERENSLAYLYNALKS